MSTTKNSVQSILCVFGLPASLNLLEIDGLGSGTVVLDGVNHHFRISGTDVGKVGSLTALLELACENRDSDCDEDGRHRLDFANTVETLRRFRFSHPWAGCSHPFRKSRTPTDWGGKRQQKSSPLIRSPSL